MALYDNRQMSVIIPSWKPFVNAGYQRGLKDPVRECKDYFGHHTTTPLLGKQRKKPIRKPRPLVDPGKDEKKSSGKDEKEAVPKPKPKPKQTLKWKQEYQPPENRFLPFLSTVMKTMVDQATIKRKQPPPTDTQLQQQLYSAAANSSVIKKQRLLAPASAPPTTSQPVPSPVPLQTVIPPSPPVKPEPYSPLNPQMIHSQEIIYWHLKLQVPVAPSVSLLKESHWILAYYLAPRRILALARGENIEKVLELGVDGYAQWMADLITKNDELLFRVAYILFLLPLLPDENRSENFNYRYPLQLSFATWAEQFVHYVVRHSTLMTISYTDGTALDIHPATVEFTSAATPLAFTIVINISKKKMVSIICKCNKVLYQTVFGHDLDLCIKVSHLLNPDEAKTSPSVILGEMRLPTILDDDDNNMVFHTLPPETDMSKRLCLQVVTRFEDATVNSINLLGEGPLWARLDLLVNIRTVISLPKTLPKVLPPQIFAHQLTGQTGSINGESSAYKQLPSPFVLSSSTTSPEFSRSRGHQRIALPGYFTEPYGFPAENPTTDLSGTLIISIENGKFRVSHTPPLLSEILSSRKDIVVTEILNASTAMPFMSAIEKAPKPTFPIAVPGSIMMQVILGINVSSDIRNSTVDYVVFRFWRVLPQFAGSSLEPLQYIPPGVLGYLKSVVVLGSEEKNRRRKLFAELRVMKFQSSISSDSAKPKLAFLGGLRSALSIDHLTRTSNRDEFLLRDMLLCCYGLRVPLDPEPLAMIEAGCEKMNISISSTSTTLPPCKICGNNNSTEESYFAKSRNLFICSERCHSELLRREDKIMEEEC
jgi:hypothetical protein